jgi:hypothetical protein
VDRDFIGGTEVNRLRGNLSIPMDDYRSNLPNRYAGGLIFSNPDNQPFSRPTDPGSLRYYMNSPAVRDGWEKPCWLAFFQPAQALLLWKAHWS